VCLARLAVNAQSEPATLPIFMGNLVSRRAEWLERLARPIKKDPGFNF